MDHVRLMEVELKLVVEINVLEHIIKTILTIDIILEKRFMLMGFGMAPHIQQVVVEPQILDLLQAVLK